ncbi:MAG: ribosome-associated translation inhibitor RaiA [Candidatus Pacebacteria bacterium]|nr:ribosome-associated translation inhibitor RaiA [Candidatus Paceibacterota bacterium]
MKINITTKNITLDKPLNVFIEQKIGGLEKFIKKGPVSAIVEVGLPSKRHKTGPVFYAEVNLSVGGKLLRGEASHKDLRSAIDQARDELHAQILKLKEKQKDLLRVAKK